LLGLYSYGIVYQLLMALLAALPVLLVALVVVVVALARWRRAPPSSVLLAIAMALIGVATFGEAAAAAVTAVNYANFPYQTTSTWSVVLAVGAPVAGGAVELLAVIAMVVAVFLGRERTDLDEGEG